MIHKVELTVTDANNVSTVVPAAFVSGVPAELVDDFDLRDAALMLGVAALFAVLGWGTFTAGLRRYASGSAWGRG